MGSEELPEWTTEMDREILEVLCSELVLTPAIIAENIGRSREAVSRRLNTLEAGELVEKIERGKYRITSKAFMQIAEPVELSEENKYKAIEEDQKRRRNLEEGEGITEEEYQKAVESEFKKLKEEKSETASLEEILSEAFSRIDRDRDGT